MRLSKIALIGLLVLAKSASAVIYLSPTGNDSGAGTIGDPWFTINKAVTAVTAGEQIWMRGGTYNYTSRQTISGISGTSGNEIKIDPYLDEVPIIDGSSLAYAENLVRMSGVSYWVVTGLTIRNSADEGIQVVNSSSNVTLQNLEVYGNGRLEDGLNGGGNGIRIASGSNNILVLNNDSHHNRDLTNGNADGIYDDSNGSGNVYRYNRTWKNSDDGLDLWQAGSGTVVDGNWSYYNGFDDALNQLGDGIGFKLGGDVPSGGHVLTNNLSWNNNGAGFDDNGSTLPHTVYNNTAYFNGSVTLEPNFSFYTVLANTIKNNLSWFPGVSDLEQGTSDYNSWNLATTITVADFTSISDVIAQGARQSNGELPVTTFLHLVEGSDLVDTGEDVGIAYTRGRPDLGAHELAAFVDANGYTNQYEYRYNVPLPHGNVDCTGVSAANPNDADEYIIRDSGGWAQINSSSDRRFYVCPGDYVGTGKITITQNGSDANSDGAPDDSWRQVKCWYPDADSDRTAYGDQANSCNIEWVEFDGGSHNWFIQGLEFNPEHSSLSLNAILVGGGGAGSQIDNTVFDRILADGTNQGDNANNTRLVQFGIYSNNSAIQNSVARNCAERYDHDIEAVSLDDDTLNARIVANELYGCGSAVFVGVGTSSSPQPLIENNDIYFTPQQYMDCATGAYTTSGNCVCGERLVNLKGAGSTVTNPLLLLNNRIWGSRVQYNECGGSGGGAGNAIDIVFGGQYVKLVENIMFDSESMIREGSCSNGAVTRNTDASLNIFHGCQNFATSGSLPCGSGSSCGAAGVETCCGMEPPGMVFHGQATGCTSHKSSYYVNTFSNASNECTWFGGSSRDTEIVANLVVDAGNGVDTSGPASYNTYAGTSADVGETEKREVDNVYDFGNYCFYRKLQTNPEQVCLSDVYPRTSIDSGFATYAAPATLDSSYGTDPN